MSRTIQIWVEIAHHAAFRCGGWAYLVSEDGALSGAAGGERTPSAERIALIGLSEALKGLPATASLEINSAAPLVLGAPARMAGFGAGNAAPEGDLQLWAQLTTALNGRSARFLRAAHEPRTPVAFTQAWADLARDKAKAAGTFRAPIPKTNLAKARV